MVLGLNVTKQQHHQSLLSQASWGRVDMIPNRKVWIPKMIKSWGGLECHCCKLTWPLQ